MYKFTRDHFNNKAGDEVKSIDNAEYLLRVGVIVKVESKVDKPGPKTTKIIK